LYEYKRIGISVGLSAARSKAAGDGKVPHVLEERARLGYELRIASRFGAMEDELFESAVEKIGRESEA
jgi:hypothetical protein